jgi:hypothetical protein
VGTNKTCKNYPAKKSKPQGDVFVAGAKMQAYPWVAQD